jgi:hypothetical protein
MRSHRPALIVITGVLALICTVVAPSARAGEKRCTISAPTNLGSTNDGTYAIVRSGDSVTVDFNVAGVSRLECDGTDPLNGASVNISIHDHLAMKTGTNEPLTGNARIVISDLNGVAFDGAAQIHGIAGCGPDQCDGTYVTSDQTKKRKHHRHKQQENVHLNVLMNLNNRDVVTYQIGSGSFFDRTV